MRLNADFQSFVGLVDCTRETSVFFPSGSMGISLVQGPGGYTEVSALKPVDGKPSAAMINGLVAVGDKLSKVNGEDVLGLMSHEVIISMVKSAPRPLLLHFLGAAVAAQPAARPEAPVAPAASAPAAQPFAQPSAQQAGNTNLSTALDEGSGLFSNADF